MAISSIMKMMTAVIAMMMITTTTSTAVMMVPLARHRGSAGRPAACP